jgi:hypothetical protein
VITASYCDRCGGELAAAPTTERQGAADHAACRAARALEPPRFCPSCRRRMKVQVLPAGWRAVCAEHGATQG